MKTASRYAGILAAAVGFGVFAAPSAAQTGSITGRVTDMSTGVPLGGVSVSIAGAQGGVATDGDGRFTISAAAGTVSLVFSSIGYESRRVDGVRVDAAAGAEVDVALTPQELMLNPVVVTASRREERSLNAPASVSTVSAQDIARVAAPTTGEHLKALPGIDVAQTGLGQMNVVARGFNNVFSGTLLTLVDNRYARVPSLRLNSYSMLPTSDLDIDRIEVSLGPGAALYGPNTTSGVMHIITASPIDRPGSTVSLTGGERSVFQSQFRTSHALSDQFGFKVSGEYFRGNDFEHVDAMEAVDANPANPVDRDNLQERYSGDARIDYRFSDDASLVFAGGMSTASQVEMTGVGAAQAVRWGYQYAQARLSKGRLFAQAFLNRTNSGDGTYLLRACTQRPRRPAERAVDIGNGRTCDGVVDKSRSIALQFQYGFDLGDWLDMTYGVDWNAIQPQTGGTITGRNEDDDNITEIGAYVHTGTALGDRFDLVAAVRVDDHSRLTDPNISPRAALVFKPSPDHNLRATFNRAFATPTTNNLFLDIAAGAVPLPVGLPGYDVRALGVPATGLTFSDRCDGGLMSLCMRSPFVPGQLPANAVALWPAILAALPALDPALGALVPALRNPGAYPTDPQLATVFRRLNPNAADPRDAYPLDQGELTDIARLESTIYNTFEVGYKGLIRDRVLLAVDAYFADVENFVGPLRVETPNVFFDPASLQAFVTARLAPLIQAGVAPPQIVGAIVQNLAALPLGTVVPDQVDASDIIVSYRNFGRIEYWGADLAAQVRLTNKLRLSTNYSYQSDECFDFNDDGNCRSTDDIALNAPNHKGSVGMIYDDQVGGLSASGRVRMSGAFPMNSGVYVGDVDGFGVVDASVSYRLPFQRNATVSVTANNLLNNMHQEFVGAPELGRLLLARVKYDF